MNINRKIELLKKIGKEVIESIFLGIADNSYLKSQEKALKYKFNADYWKEWEDAKNCIYKNCKNKSIKKSHTIQKSSALKLISENNKVFRPFPNVKTNLIDIKTVNIASASTFPGFCSEHEQLFHQFEYKGFLENNSDFILQIYRSICREIVRLKYEVEKDNLYFEANFFYKKFSRYFREKAKPYIDAGKITNKDLDNFLKAQNKNSKKSENYRKILPVDLNDLEANLLPQINQLLKNEQAINNNLLIKTLPFKLPVSLSGLECHRPSKDERILAILTVIPEETQTHIIICTKKENMMFVKEYTNGLGYFDWIGLIEAAMLMSTDHWFLSPSVWNKLPVMRQLLIRQMISFSDSSSLFPTHVSIFDTTRMKLLMQLKEYSECHNEKTKKVIKYEEAKLNYLKEDFHC